MELLLVVVLMLSLSLPANGQFVVKSSADHALLDNILHSRSDEPCKKVKTDRGYSCFDPLEYDTMDVALSLGSKTDNPYGPILSTLEVVTTVQATTEPTASPAVILMMSGHTKSTTRGEQVTTLATKLGAKATTLDTYTKTSEPFTATSRPTVPSKGTTTTSRPTLPPSKATSHTPPWHKWPKFTLKPSTTTGHPSVLSQATSTVPPLKATTSRVKSCRKRNKTTISKPSATKSHPTVPYKASTTTSRPTAPPKASTTTSRPTPPCMTITTTRRPIMPSMVSTTSGPTVTLSKGTTSRITYWGKWPKITRRPRLPFVPVFPLHHNWPPLMCLFKPWRCQYNKRPTYYMG